MNRYSAQKQYWKAKQTKQDKEKIADVVLLQKLQVGLRAAERLSSLTGAGHTWMSGVGCCSSETKGPGG